MDDIRWIEGLIYIVAVLGGLLLPVFKQIREKRRGKPIVLEGEEAPASAEDSQAPMVEQRDPWDVPEPTIGKVPERQVGEFAEPARTEFDAQRMGGGFTAPRHAEPLPPPAAPAEPEPVSLSEFQGFAGVEKRGRAKRRPSAAPRPSASAPRSVRSHLRGAAHLRRAFVLKEVLDRPVALREGREGLPPGWP